MRGLCLNSDFLPTNVAKPQVDFGDMPRCWAINTDGASGLKWADVIN